MTPVPVVEEGVQIPVKDGAISFVCVTRRQYATLHAISHGLLAVGSFKWDTTADGEVTGLYVSPEWRHRGVATLLWNVATELSAERDWPAPRHSPNRTSAGDAFARAIGGEIPDGEGRDDGDFGFASDLSWQTP